MSNGFTGFEDIHDEKSAALLMRLIQSTNFTRICAATPDGIGLYQDGTELNVADSDYFQRGIRGEAGVSKLQESKYSGQNCFIIYAPIHAADGSVKGVLFGTYEPIELQQVISVKSYDNGGGTYLYEASGGHITSSINPGKLEMGDDTIQNFIDSCETEDNDIQRYVQDIQEGRSGYLDFKRGGEHYLGYYQPTGVRDWYIMCVTSDDTIMKHIRNSAKYSALLLFSCMTCLCTVVFFIAMDERKLRRAEVKQLKDKQSRITEQYANEIKNSYDAILEFDYGNNRVCNYIFTDEGYERNEAESKTIIDALDELKNETISNIDIGDIREFFSRERLNRLFMSGKIEVNIDVQKRNQDGAYNWFTLFMRKVHWSEDGDQIAMFYAKNVNDLYQEQRQNHKLTLDALKLAKDANHAKSDFLARMSHDIRTPMNAITGMTAIAKNYLDDRERLLDCIEKIEHASKYLLSLINDVLDMSRIESGKMELLEEEIVFNDFFADISQLIRTEAEKKGIQYIDETIQADQPEIFADKLHLQQIMMNLLSNAVKFTDEGGTVCIKAEKIDESEQHSTYRFTVSDTGIGIKEDKIDRIFQPFERADEVSRTGTGLGLSIAQNLINLMNGVISVESRVGQGTVFTIEIPFHKVIKSVKDKEHGRKSIGYRRSDFANKKVLLVEDNEINMEIGKVFLENVDMIIDTAVNGKEAWELYQKAEAGYYDIIITDIRMPVMDGRELTERIRKSSHADAKTIPIIAMSADAFSEEIQLSQSVGMNDYVTKPINDNDLYRTIHKYI